MVDFRFCGDYYLFASAFTRFCGVGSSRAKRGEIVANCVVERGHKDGVQEAVSPSHDL